MAPYGFVPVGILYNFKVFKSCKILFELVLSFPKATLNTSIENRINVEAEQKYGINFYKGKRFSFIDIGARV